MPERRRRAQALRILITAGPTREYLDPVRYLSNDSSGSMGFETARAAARRGHRVTLIHGPVALTAPPRVKCVGVVSAAEMLAACERAWREHDVLVMSAAVADYTLRRPSATKRKKDGSSLVLTLRPTVDILARLSRRRRKDQLVIGFALEDRRPRVRAADKLERKRLDAIVLNSPRAIGAAASQVDVLVRGGAWQSWKPASKRVTARRLVELAERLAAAL